MFRLFTTWLVILLSTVACSENDIRSIKNEEPIPTPEIEVTPLSIDFGELPSTANELRTVAITNLSTVALHVSDVQLSGHQSFTMMIHDTEFVLGENETLEFEIYFTPEQGGDLTGDITIFSDDTDEPEVVVELQGVLATPELVISPDPYDFGDIDIPCSDVVEVTLSNIGLEPLEVFSVDFTTSDGQMWMTDENTWPLTLGAMEEATVTVAVEGFMSGNSVGTISVDSTDPRGIVESSQTANIAYIQSGVEQFIIPDPVIDVFNGPLKSTETFTAPTRVDEQFILPDNPPVDILFAVDQSCSMDSNNVPLGNAFSSFITEINNVTNDWRIGVATNDDGCFNGGVIDSQVPGYNSVFQSAVASGGCASGSPYCDTEALFRVAETALSKTGNGYCNQNFLRTGAFLHIIFVSDEEEQSGTGWSSWLSQYTNYVASNSLLKVSTIADIYTQCGDGTGADGYEEMASFTGGEVLDVCTSNWSTKTQDLALATIAGINELPLSAAADISSIEVYVDGVQWTTDWHYDSTTQSVVFDVAMDGGEDVEIIYVPSAWSIDYVLTDTPVSGTITVYVDGVNWLSNWVYNSSTNSIVFATSLPDGATIDVEYLSSTAIVEFPLSSIPNLSTLEVRVDNYAWPTNWTYSGSSNTVRFDVTLPEGALIEVEYMDVSASSNCPLAYSPDPLSLHVYVDGVEWLQDWHYDSATQSVIFDVLMDPGSVIDISYGVFATCP